MYHAGLTLTLYLVFLFLKALGNSRCGHSCKISRVWEYPWEHLVRWKFSLYTPLQNFRQIDSYVVFIAWGLHCIYFLCSRSPRVWFWFCFACVGLWREPIWWSLSQDAFRISWLPLMIRKLMKCWKIIHKYLDQLLEDNSNQLKRFLIRWKHSRESRESTQNRVPRSNIIASDLQSVDGSGDARWTRWTHARTATRWTHAHPLRKMALLKRVL